MLFNPRALDKTKCLKVHNKMLIGNQWLDKKRKQCPKHTIMKIV